MRNRWAVLAGAALLALLALGAWALATTGSPDGPIGPTREGETNGGPDGQEDPVAGNAAGPAEDTASPLAATPGTPLPPTAVATEDGRAPTPGADEVAPPTPSPGEPPPDAPPLVGEAVVGDPTGDLVDTAGLPPPSPQPAADLTEVRLTGDGQEFLIEFDLAGEVPATAGSLVWSLDIWLHGTLAYTVTVQQVGGRIVAGVLDWETGEQVPPVQAPQVQGDSVAVRLPRSMLERVDGPFQWQAMGQADGGYEDYVPEDGTLTWFPAHGP